MHKRRNQIIIALALTLTVIGGVAISLLVPSLTKTQVQIKILETNTTASVNGGQSIMVKTKDKNILIDTGSGLYTTTTDGVAMMVDEFFDGRIDTLILTSMSPVYNGGLLSLFDNKSFPKPIGIKNIYYPGYEVDNDVFKDLSSLLKTDPLKEAKLCGASKVMQNLDSSCPMSIDLSSNYQLQLMNTSKYVEVGSKVEEEEMTDHNLIFSINNKEKDSFYFMMDGGVSEASLGSFNSHNQGLKGRVKSWVLSAPDLQPYINRQYTLGFKPEHTIFTASSVSASSYMNYLFTRMPYTNIFKELLNVSKDKIYTPFTMGNITVSLSGNSKMRIKGSRVNFYQSVGNTEDKPFIYSFPIRNNANYTNVIKEILGIDVSY